MTFEQWNEMRRLFALQLPQFKTSFFRLNYRSGAITTVERPWSAALTNSKTNLRLTTSACDLSLLPSQLSWLHL